MKNKKDSNKNRENSTFFYSKLSKKEKEVISKLTVPSQNGILTLNGLIEFEKIKEIIGPISKKYKVNLYEVLDFIKDQLNVPASIFSKKLTILEAIVKYLKEDKNLSLSEISIKIKRDERNLWGIYDKTKKKHPSPLNKTSSVLIPIPIFSNERLSALESLVTYLKEDLSLSYHEIAVLIDRNDRTIWTVYQRARKKNVE